MAQNGSENGSGDCSEAPDADSRHSRPGNFRSNPSPDLDQVSELLDLVFGAPGAVFKRFGSSKKNLETSFLES